MNEKVTEFEIKKELLDRADVLNGVDDDLLEEAMRKPRARRFPWLAAAAAAVVVAAAAIVLPKLLKDPSGEITVSVPTPEPTECIEATQAPTNVPEPTAEATLEPVPTEEATPAPAPGTETPTKTPQATQMITPLPTASPSSEPTEYADVQVFASFEELHRAAAEGGHDSPDDALYGLNEYFVPNKLPEGAELEKIVVYPFMVSVTYDCGDLMPHEEGERCLFTLQFRRTWSTGDAEKWAVEYGRASERTTHEYNGVWIVEPSVGGINRIAAWEEDGRSFVIIFPGCYTEDEDALAFTDLTRVALP